MKNFIILALVIALAFMTWICYSIPTPIFMCYEDQYKATDLNGREFCINIDDIQEKHNAIR